jgi:hypothetical protein
MGHGIEWAAHWMTVASAVLTFCVLFAAAVTESLVFWDLIAPVILWTSGWTLLWSAVRQNWFGWRWLAPRPRRHERKHPAVSAMVEDGWEFGARPPLS